MKRTTPQRPCAAALLALAAGCGPADEPPPGEISVAAAESVEATLIEGSLLILAADGLQATPGDPPGGGPRARVAEFVASRVAGAFRPDGCATARASAGTVNLSLRNCAGVGRLASIEGDVTLSYEVTRLAPLALTVNARSPALRVNAVRVDLDVTVDAAAERVGGPWVLAVRTRTASATGREVRLTRAGDYALRWDPATRCASADGAWRTSSPRGTWDTRLAGFRSCMGRCPQVGGSVTLTSVPPSQTITLTFTGSATAQWSTAAGTSGTLLLACEN